jgi:hypothetical protein
VCIFNGFFVYSVGKYGESFSNISGKVDKMSHEHFFFCMITELLNLIICVTVVWVIVDLNVPYMMNGAVAVLGSME